MDLSWSRSPLSPTYFLSDLHWPIKKKCKNAKKRTETQVHGAHLGTGKFANAWTGREGDRCCDFCVLGCFFSILKCHFSSDTWLVNDINKILFISTPDTLSLHSMVQHSWCYLIHDLTSSCVPVSLLFFLFLLFLFPSVILLFNKWPSLMLNHHFINNLIIL